MKSKTLAVLIIDMDKFTTDEWAAIGGKYLYWARIEDASFGRITDHVERVQEDELRARREE